MPDSALWTLPWYVVGDIVCATTGEHPSADETFAWLAGLSQRELNTLVHPPANATAEPAVTRIVREQVEQSQRPHYAWSAIVWPSDLRVYFRQMPADRPHEIILGPRRLVLPWPQGDPGTPARDLADKLGAPVRVATKPTGGGADPYDFDPKVDVYANAVLMLGDRLVKKHPNRIRSLGAREAINQEAAGDVQLGYMHLPASLGLEHHENRHTDETSISGLTGALRIDFGLKPERYPTTAKAMFYRNWPCGAWTP